MACNYFFKDWEISSYDNYADYFEKSGCEEYDFLIDVGMIVDFSGHVLNYKQDSKQLVMLDKIVDKKYILDKYISFFTCMNKLDINVELFIQDSKNISSLQVMKMAYDYYEF